MTTSAPEILDDVLLEQKDSPLAKSFRRFDDSQLMRFMWLAGDDIPIADRSGGRFWGLYEGEVIGKRRLVPIRHARCLGINEYPALIGTAEQVAMPNYLAPIEAEGFDRANSTRVARAPRVVAYEIMGEYEDSACGPALFEHAQLMGDDKRDLVVKLYRAIVARSAFADPDPAAARHWYGEGSLKPVTRKGVKFLGLVTNTWLDQWVKYLNEFAAENVRSANLPRHKPKNVEGTDTPLSEHELALYMLERMQEAAQRAWTNQTAYLESSRDQIIGKRNGGTGKRWYDLRDERYLLETGFVPLNLEEIAAATQAQTRSEATMLAGIEKLVERINPVVPQGAIAESVQRAVDQRVGEVFDALSLEQLDALIARKRAALDAVEVEDPATLRQQRRAAKAASETEAAAGDGAQEEYTGDIEDVISAPLDVDEEDEQ